MARGAQLREREAASSFGGIRVGLLGAALCAGLAPLRILGGLFAVIDFGRVVHDYLKDPAVWG